MHRNWGVCVCVLALYSVILLDFIKSNDLAADYFVFHVCRHVTRGCPHPPRCCVVSCPQGFHDAEQWKGPVSLVRPDFGRRCLTFHRVFHACFRCL